MTTTTSRRQRRLQARAEPNVDHVHRRQQDDQADGHRLVGQRRRDGVHVGREADRARRGRRREPDDQRDPPRQNPIAGPYARDR